MPHKKKTYPRAQSQTVCVFKRDAAGWVNFAAFVAQVVALAFGLAAATIFPALFLGIFTSWVTREGSILGMLSGLLFTMTYIIYFKFIFTDLNNPDYWLFEISPEGIGVIGMFINFVVAMFVSKITLPPPRKVTELVREIRKP